LGRVQAFIEQHHLGVNAQRTGDWDEPIIKTNITFVG
jgi:hypothetical protein